jgi:hypothetical protein
MCVRDALLNYNDLSMRCWQLEEAHNIKNGNGQRIK